MKKVSIFLTIIMMSIVSMFSFNLFAATIDNGLTVEENASFITREEFEEWRESFIKTLSELDAKSTDKIYSNMDFYDMQFKFTDKYKTAEYYDEDTKQNTDKLNEMIMEEKAKRGLL